MEVDSLAHQQAVPVLVEVQPPASSVPPQAAPQACWEQPPQEHLPLVRHRPVEVCLAGVHPALAFSVPVPLVLL